MPNRKGLPMVKLIRSLALLVLVSIPIAAQPAGVPFRNPSAAVASAYGQLSAQPIARRRALYAAMPASMRADLWAMHLSNFLQDHDLNTEERAVILEAIGIVEAGLLETEPSSAQWKSTTQLLAKHVEQARSDVVFDALSVLGGPEISVSGKARSLRTDWLPGDDCECNTSGVNFCCWGDCPTSTTPNCHPSSRFGCIPAHGCGLFWLEDCDGICGA